jgi:hypothetical protein
MFDFIKDKALQAILNKSTFYLLYLYGQSNTIDDDSHKEETYRVIILYVVSVIEAILFYFYKQYDKKILKIEYSNIQSLPQQYINKDKNDSIVVIATQSKTERKEETIGISELINFFKSEKKIHKKTVQEILKINNIRNTFHLNKTRNNICDIKHVESAINLLIHTIQTAPNSLKV